MFDFEIAKSVRGSRGERYPDLGTIDRFLKTRFSAYSETPTLDSKVLLSHILKKPKSWVVAHPEYRMGPGELDPLGEAVERLDRGEPLPYVLGAWEFFGLSMVVTPDVLIPRPETELLVETAIDWLLSRPDRRLAADVGTGSGCIAVALAARFSNLRVTATDVSFSALKTARQNADFHHVASQIDLAQADLLSPVQAKFDLICANLPYIPSEVLRTLPVSIQEPHLALDGGADGLTLNLRLLENSKHNLRPGGLLLLEIEAGQGSQVLSAAKSFYPEGIHRIMQDLAGFDRLLAVQNPG